MFTGGLLPSYLLLRLKMDVTTCTLYIVIVNVTPESFMKTKAIFILEVLVGCCWVPHPPIKHES